MTKIKQRTRAESRNKLLAFSFFVFGSFVTLTLVSIILNGKQEESMASLRQPVAPSFLSSSSSCYPKVGFRPLKEREELGDLLEEHGFTTGVEVGVKQGDFAKVILDKWKSCKSYTLVDVWAHQENYKDIANVADATHNQFYEQTKAALQQYSTITEFLKMYSSEAAKKIDKNSVDYVYLDARHDYCGVLEDIENYWPLIKPGGIMAGHDYNSNDEIRGQDWGLCGDGITRNEGAVKGAVNDFFLPKGITISVTYYRQHNYMSWIVQKPLC